MIWDLRPSNDAAIAHLPAFPPPSDGALVPGAHDQRGRGGARPREASRNPILARARIHCRVELLRRQAE
jgi:hypothetical protein